MRPEQLDDLRRPFVQARLLRICPYQTRRTFNKSMRCNRLEPPISPRHPSPFRDRYFQIVEILPGVENAYAKNYDRSPLTA
jgi:hypothetical protein